MRNVYGKIKMLVDNVSECIDSLSNALDRMYKSTDITENDKDRMADYILSKYIHQTFVDPLHDTDINELPENIAYIISGFTNRMIQMIDTFSSDTDKRNNINKYCKQLAETSSIFSNMLTKRYLRDVFGDEVFEKLSSITTGSIWAHQRDFKLVILKELKEMICQRDDNISYGTFINEFLKDVELLTGKNMIIDENWQTEIGKGIDALPTKQQKIDFIDKNINDIENSREIKTLNDVYELNVFLTEIQSVLKTFKGKDALGDILTVQLMAAVKAQTFPEELLTDVLAILDPARNGEPYDVDELMDKIRKSIAKYLPSEKDLILDGMKTGAIKILIEDDD